ncbi:flagellar type III secretion system pore protein FliP [Pluralibacter sp.]|jgi:flagellar biosynthetic protein FliP|uniref:flagellar type III secretion system pore protein FliP n=1 Tax=Pluralibacter sp. TaxID=1920032 RepID=UPI0025E0A6FF|nr:flagellar type III secretion system pore protein FliP [Pluralibacter sp.]MBV8043267.1 flagellar type III secretion system pore protein FliP [Pluralibacter sp.]
MRAVLLLLLTVFPVAAFASDVPLLTITNGEGQQDYSVKLQVLLLMTMLGLIPSMLLLMTCFTRIIIVLGILRQAIGLQSSPPNRLLISIALSMTVLLMKPIWQDIYQNAFVPYDEDKMTLVQAVSRAEQPIRKFMLAQTRKTDLDLMLRVAGEPRTTSVQEVNFFILMPAFVLSELKTAFQIGFMLFIPFVVIDMVVATVLMSMGMMMLSPVIISLPIKLMVFVLADGWSMVVNTLSMSFGGIQ